MTGYEHRLRVCLREQPSGFAISPRLPLTSAGNHQLDLPPEYKYEHNSGNSPDMVAIRDGASLPRLFAFSAHCRSPALARKYVLD